MGKFFSEAQLLWPSMQLNFALENPIIKQYGHGFSKCDFRGELTAVSDLFYLLDNNLVEIQISSLAILQPACEQNDGLLSAISNI